MSESNTTQPGHGAVESVARNLVSLLLSTLSPEARTERPGPSVQQRPGPSVQQRPGPSNIAVQQEMSRSFPCYYGSKAGKRGKKRFLTAIKDSTSKTFTFNFYLLPKNTSKTPLPEKELELLQMGLGRQTVCVPEDSNHTEISRILTEAYPKMEALCGGWLLHKAAGGGGQRKLIVIPPDAEGYCATALRAVSSGGKATFYIVPLQETLDTSPLPPDSHHFAKMPKSTCQRCNKSMPLHMLAVHIKTCKGQLSDGTEDQTSEDEWVVEDNTKNVVCPICTKELAEDYITIHASHCGDCDSSEICTWSSAANNTDESTAAQAPVCTPKSADDVLSFLEEQVDTTKEFKLCVSREDLLERGILQWNRKKVSPVSTVKVQYIGEAGIDTGALRKEFLTDMVSGVENRFFEGTGGWGKNPKYSLTDLDNENFRTVGEILAVSLAQGGPAPAFLNEWCYNFLCTGDVNLHSLSKEDVTDLESSLLISKVENAADTESLMLWADDILTCGYTRQINKECKEMIIRAIVLHSTTRLIPILQQLRKGMALYGLVDQMAANSAACKALFVPGKIIKPDADFIMMHCKPSFSEKGTLKEKAERKLINFLQDFLEELEASDETVGTASDDTETLSVQDVLKWMTGQAHIPILPQEKRDFKITFDFEHNCQEKLGVHTVCYPTASACSCTVTFPVEHLTNGADFKRIMTEAVRYGGGFYRV